MPNGDIFNVEDYRGKMVVFRKAKWEEKRSDHPELNKDAFIDCLKRAIADPDEVWEDYGDRKNRRCYYKRYSGVIYAKAVVWITAVDVCHIVTAYQINYVKEMKYPDLKRVR